MRERGADGHMRALGDDRDRSDSDHEPCHDAGDHGRERLGQDERRLLRERRAALAEPAQLGAHVAPKGARGQAGEGEQEHGGGATDEQDAP